MCIAAAAAAAGVKLWKSLSDDIKESKVLYKKYYTIEKKIKVDYDRGIFHFIGLTD